VLVAMNPAALRSQLEALERGGTIIVNTDAFTERNLAKAGYEADPLADDSLRGYTVYEVPMTQLTKDAVAPLGVKPRDAERSKNFFALGLVSWMYSRPSAPTLDWIEQKFGQSPEVAEANRVAFGAGHAFGETAELFGNSYTVKPARLEPGTYTNITGSTALAWGIIAAGHLAELPVYLGSYPITPASDILHELSRHKNFGVRTLQAEDEIAAVTSAVGASFGGQLAVTTTSGPGVALKSEAIGLAVNLELPMLIIDVQRGGPSTGLPTKTEQADLLQAMFGRHGESPLPVIAARTPSDLFDCAIEAARMALKYRTPVILLSDGYLANGSEPWKLPDVSTLPDISTPFATEPNSVDPEGNPIFHGYDRDPETLARPWAVPGTPGLEHRIGGLEKEDGTGNVSYDPQNHSKMVHLRADKIAGIVADVDDVVPEGDPDADILVVGWGSTWGAIGGAVDRCRVRDHKVARIHLRHLNPLPANLGDVLRRYDKILVPEMNTVSSRRTPSSGISSCTAVRIE
jgi:2-oxoglutarate ferredoxin oxidoreductase subunit alpha